MSHSDSLSSPSAALVPPRAPPSPPDSISSSGVNSDHVRTTSNTSASFATCSRRSSSSSSNSAASIQSLHIASVPSSTLSSNSSHQRAVPIVSPFPIEAATAPSSLSECHSTFVSPNIASDTYRANSRSQEHGEAPSDLGSGDVAGAEGLIMPSVGLGSPTTSSDAPASDSKPIILEEGEIREDSLSSPPFSAVSNEPSGLSASVHSPRDHMQREASLGGAIPSSPEVMPRIQAKLYEVPSMAKPDSSTAALNNDGNTPRASVTPVPGDSTSNPSAAVTSTSPSAGLSSLLTSSTLSSIPSTSSFHTASSSTTLLTPISNSASINDITLCSSTSASQSLTSSGCKVPDTGTIDLEDIKKDDSNKLSSLSVNTSNLNPNAVEHVPTAYSNVSGDDGSVDNIETHASGDHKTPNVYINGLPPHFPEDQLFELASPFGEIRSVRSFTRHVGEKESGYGFVLFETVEAAEKCIQSLRRFRNLHPTFSKQAHKIPGMPYVQTHTPLPTGWEQGGSDTQESQVGGTGTAYGSDAGSTKSESNSFKAKMERLQDPNSTNLYIEGLPLSIDDAALAALVSPHRIKSSRLFQTRLSNPPRIIAFVRLETRVGAEDVIERLHGRMVRGWNDPGSRISVRFADTSEQRELRRTERSVREDDSSPARLTIAQAALLNLRGRDQLRSQSGVTAPPIGSSRIFNASAPTANQVYDNFSSSAHDISSLAAGGYRGSASDLTSAAALLAGIGALNVGGPRRSVHTSPYHHNTALPPVLHQNSQDLTPAMAALLDSLRGNGNAWNGNSDRYDSRNHQSPNSHSPHPVLGDVDLNLVYPNQYQQRAGGGVAQTRSGYTPAEEFILQAHAAQRRKNPRGDFAPSEYRQGGHGGEHADFNVGMRGYRTQASTITLPQSQQQPTSSYSSGGPLPAVPESDADYIISPSNQAQKYPQSQLNSARNSSNAVQSRAPRDRDTGKAEHQQPMQQYSTQNPITSSQARLPVREFNSVGNQGYSQQAHVRSTTLPPSSTPSATQHSRHYQHSSMSIPKTRNISTDTLRTTTQELPSLHSKHRSTNSISSITNDSKNSNGIYADNNDIHNDGATYTNEVSNSMYHRNFSKNGEQDYKKNYDPHHNVYTSSPSFRDSDVYDVPQSSPPLVSPALTYSSRGSAATLSPSTPYVGSFSQGPAGGSFQGRSIETEVVDGR